MKVVQIQKNPSPPLCKNCRHSIPVNWFEALILWTRWRYAKCGISPMDTKRSTTRFVDGKPDKRKNEDLYYCSTARLPVTLPGHCGEEGKLFQPKESHPC